MVLPDYWTKLYNQKLLQMFMNWPYLSKIWCFTYTLQGILYYKPAVFGTPCHPRGAWLTKRPGLANKTRIVWLWPLSIAYVWPRYVLSASFTCVHLFARNPLCVLKICCRFVIHFILMEVIILSLHVHTFLHKTIC